MIRALAAIEAVVILVLLALLLMRTDAPPAPPADGGSARETPTRPASPGPNEAPLDPELDASAEPSVGEARALTLHGRIRRADGESIPYGWLSLVDDAGTRVSGRIDDRGYYAILGVPPGSYRLHVTVPGCAPQDEVVEMPADRDAVRKDIELRGALTVGVRLVTPDGGEFGKALEALELAPMLCWNIMRALGAIATSDAPPPSIAPFPSARVDRHGIGEYRSDESGQAADGRIGDLSIRAALPVHVSAVLRHAVLGTVRLAEPTDVVEIVVDPRQVVGQLGRLTFRIRREGDPDVEAIWFDLSDMQSSGQSEAERDGDRFTIAPTLPGRLEFDIRGPAEWEAYHRLVTIPPGETLDLGVIEIRRAATLAGHVVDEEGKPIAGARLDYYDTALPYHDQRTSRSHIETSADGSFTPWGMGPRRYVFRVRVKDRIRQAFEVDLSNGSIDDLVLRVGRGTRLTLVRGTPGSVGGTIEDARGFIVSGFRVLPSHPNTFFLRPGRYVIAVSGGRRIPIEVGPAPGPPVVLDDR